MNARVLSLVLISLVLFAGCMPRKAQAPTVLPDARAAYHYAVETYQTGAYSAAAKLFGEIADTAPDPLLARQAFFGLVLSRLAGARTPEEFDAAQELWRTWYSLAPSDPAWEDPRLMAPLLQRLRPEVQDKTVDKVLQPKAEKAEPDCSGPLKKLAAARQENETLKARLKELALENERLRGQLSALEKLHEEILIKKKGFD